jgi:hypothetical protein
MKDSTVPFERWMRRIIAGEPEFWDVFIFVISSVI